MAHLGSNRGSRNNSTDVEYFQVLFGNQLRPNGQMSIEEHRVCGYLLKQVTMATEGRPGAHAPVTTVRHILDDWAMQEYGHNELDNDTLAGLYCPGPLLEPGNHMSLNVLIERLERVKSNLERHYPCGLALQGMLRQLDLAITSIGKWNGKPRGKVYREPPPRNEIRTQRRA